MRKRRIKFDHNKLIGKKFGRLTVVNDSRKRTLNGSVIYTCVCECGNFIRVVGKNLISGNTKSCGCLKKERSKTNAMRIGKRNGGYNRLPSGEAAVRDLYKHRYKRSAKRRRIKFDLSLDEFKKLTQENCYYCGAKPNQIYKKAYISMNGDYKYNGVDRIDNMRGYVVGNIVACCGVCNAAKSDMPIDKFLEHINKIYWNRCIRHFL